MKNDFEDSKLQFWKNCDSHCFDKQDNLIRACIERAIDEWIKREIAIRCPDYQIKNIWWLCADVSYELNYFILTNKSLTAERIAQSLNTNFNENNSNNENFSVEVFSKIAEKILAFLSEALPTESRITLPENLWDMEEYNSVCANFDSAKNMRVCIEYYQFNTIIEGKIVGVKELKQMFKKAIAIRKNQIVKDEGYTYKQFIKLSKKYIIKQYHKQKSLNAAEQGIPDRMSASSKRAYGEFAELFCKLFDFKIIKVIPYIGMLKEMYNYTLDIDTDIVLERVGGWDKEV